MNLTGILLVKLGLNLQLILGIIITAIAEAGVIVEIIMPLLHNAQAYLSEKAYLKFPKMSLVLHQHYVVQNLKLIEALAPVVAHRPAVGVHHLAAGAHRLVAALLVVVDALVAAVDRFSYQINLNYQQRGRNKCLSIVR